MNVMDIIPTILLSVRKIEKRDRIERQTANESRNKTSSCDGLLPQRTCFKNLQKVACWGEEGDRREREKGEGIKGGRISL